MNFFKGIQIFVADCPAENEEKVAATSWLSECFDFVSNICLNKTEDSVLRLYYFQDFNIKQISETLNISTKEVTSIKSKALTKCRIRDRWTVFYKGPQRFQKQLKTEHEYDLATKLKNFISNKDILTEKIEYLNFSNHTYTALMNNKIATVEKLANKTCNDLLKLKGVGIATIEEILTKFKSL